MVLSSVSGGAAGSSIAKICAALYSMAASAPAIRRIANDVVDAKERVPSMRMLFKAQDMLDALGRCRFAMA